jgi:serine protease Do
MSRTREWIKLGSLVGIAAALLIVFAATTNGPASSFAQQPASYTTLVDRPAPVTAAATVADLGEAFTAVSEAVRPSVVYIEARARVEDRPRRQVMPDLPPPFDRFFDMPEGQELVPRPPRGTGSGFIISPDGYIMTNNHVVEEFDEFTVQLFDRREFSATVVGQDPNTDIAVLKIDATGLPAVSFANSDNVRVGEWALAIGNPFGAEYSFTVTAGIVSGRGRPLRELQAGNQWAIGDFIQTDAAINPGNSGGPLVNINGQVVGMNAAIASRTGTYAGYSFAIPINLARTVADQLIKEGHVTRAALGVFVRNADPLDAEAVGLDSVQGVVVTGFPDGGSPAQEAGLEVGDVITRIGDQSVEYVAQLQQVVGFRKPGERVEVTVMRDGQAKAIPVRLTSGGSEDQPRVASAERGGARPETVAQTKLGVSVAALPEQMAARLDESQRGVVVERVDPNGPARDALLAGMRGYLDIITHVNGTRVTTPAQLNRALADVAPGQVVTLRLWRIQPNQEGPALVRIRARRDTT